MALTRRNGNVFTISSASNLQSGTSYTVTAYPLGAIASAGSSGTTATVYKGHGFVANQYMMVGVDSTTFVQVTAITATTLTLASATTISTGDVLFNLGGDTGTTTPNWDGSTVTIYSTPDTTTSITNSKVTVASDGEFHYWLRGDTGVWELIRDTTGAAKDYALETSPTTQGEFNVKDFGAVGDGSTDDAYALQAAASAVTSSGGTVYLPPGTYLTSAQIYIKSNTRVLGAGSGVTTVKRKSGSVTDLTTVGTAAVFGTGPSAGTLYDTTTSGTNISFENLTIDGNVSAFSSQTVEVQAFCLHCKGVDGLWILGCQIQNALQDGAYIRDSRNVVVSGNIVNNVGQWSTTSTRNGFTFISYDATGAWGIRASFSGNVIKAAHDEGISCYNSSDVSITGNNISGGITCIEIVGDGTTTDVHGISITGNEFHDTTQTSDGGFGVLCGLSSGQPGYALTISGNSFRNIYFDAIFCNYVNGLVISNNSIYKTNQVNNAIYAEGIGLLNCTYSTVSNNSLIFSSPGSNINGINIYTTTDSVISGNVVDAPSQNCISLNKTTQNCIVIGNRVKSGVYGVAIANTGTNSGNSVLSNYPTGQSSSAYIDSSGQTNYSDVWASGAHTIPGALTTTGGIASGKPYNIRTIGVTAASVASNGMNDTACTNGTAYVGSVFVPQNCTITGIGYLVGSVGGTDSAIVSLHNASGTLLANSAQAGTTVGTANQLQQIAFTATYAAVGPAYYFVAVTFNGTTAKFQTIPAYIGGGVVGNGVTQTFGTSANFTAPTTFTANKVPVASLY